MKDIITVIKFTMKDMVKRKSFIISTVIILVLIVIGFNVPNIIKSIKGEDSEDKLLIVDNENIFEGNLELLKEADLGYEIEVGTASFEEIKEKIENEEIAKAIIVEKQDNNMKIRYIVENTNFMDEVPETIVSAINSLYTNIQISKHTIFKEPFKKINSERKLEKKLPNYLSLDEAKRLINLYENSTDEIEIRDNAMLHIFLNCGLRLSEIKNLNIEDINLDDNKFTIIGKGNKERTNYLNKKTKDALIKYLKIRDNSHDNNKKHNNALFLTFYGYRMSQFTINKIVKRAYRKAELDENVYTVHTLRHTCATLLYRSGVNIKTIQELLGHVHIDTTEIYTHLDNQEVKDVMFEHPLAQFKMEDALAYCA